MFAGGTIWILTHGHCAPMSKHILFFFFFKEGVRVKIKLLGIGPQVLVRVYICRRVFKMATKFCPAALKGQCQLEVRDPPPAQAFKNGRGGGVERHLFKGAFHREMQRGIPG